MQNQQFHSKSKTLKNGSLFDAKLRCGIDALFCGLARTVGDEGSGSVTEIRPSPPPERPSSPAVGKFQILSFARAADGAPMRTDTFPDPSDLDGAKFICGRLPPGKGFGSILTLRSGAVICPAL